MRCNDFMGHAYNFYFVGKESLLEYKSKPDFISIKYEQQISTKNA